MSVTSVQIPVGQLGAIRESLLDARREIEREAALPRNGSAMPPSEAHDDRVMDRLEEIDRLLEQVESGDRGGEPRQLTGPRPALWNAVYDSACSAAERLAEECNEYWRGGIAATDLQAMSDDVQVRLGLLELLGPPPRERRGRP